MQHVLWFTIFHRVMEQRNLGLVGPLTITLLQIYCLICFGRTLKIGQHLAKLRVRKWLPHSYGNDRLLPPLISRRCESLSSTPRFSEFGKYDTWIDHVEWSTIRLPSHALVKRMYTVFQKTATLFFGRNFCKSTPIFIILSPRTTVCTFWTHQEGSTLLIVLFVLGLRSRSQSWCMWECRRSGRPAPISSTPE